MTRSADHGPRTTAQRIADLEASVAANPPRPTQGSQAAAVAVNRAQHLAGLVRDESADTIGAYLDQLDRDQLYALVVTLAATVDVDEVLADRLEWVRLIGVGLERERNAATYAARKVA